MSDRVLQSLVHAVRRRAAEDPGAGSDAELLSRFVLSRDASAFELLVWRHGAMVEGVCRRILGRSADVEDAFQATFMALLKQARSIRRQSSAHSHRNQSCAIAGHAICSAAVGQCPAAGMAAGTVSIAAGRSDG